MNKKIILLWTFLQTISVCFLYAQLKPIPIFPPPTKEQEDTDRINHECEYLNKYSVAQRDSFYPFNISKNIKLVSFDVKPDKNGFVSPDGRLPVRGKKLIYSDLLEIKTLDEIQIDSLTDILYNNVYRGTFFTIKRPGCYNPRNAIIFVNEKGSMIAFIEICFECTDYRTSSSKVKTGDFCNQKYDLLKAFFCQVGIEFGITKGLDE